jgi:GntR family transcriptional repressor for pyruvate dehydrogenase complex
MNPLDDQPDIVATLARLRTLIQEMLQRRDRQLPPERQLAEQFGVGRATVRKALAILEDDGNVVRHVGRGTFVNSGAGSAPPQLQALALGGALAIDSSIGLSPRELLEVRYALEPAIAELAALAAREPDIELMQECMRKREEASQLDDYEQWDFALHMAIAKATHNSLLTEMLDLVNRMRRSGSWRKFRGPSVKPKQRETSNAQHRAIVNAICRADPGGAFAAMRMHLGMVSGRYRAYSHMENAEKVAEGQE